MDTPIEAIFENGVLRPLQPLDLDEHELVLVTVTSTGDSDAERAAALEAVRRGLAEADAGQLEPFEDFDRRFRAENGLPPQS